MRWHPETPSNRIHLAIEGSVGGTTIGLHMSADVIDNGGRVLWIGLEMPNSERFPQLFSHISPVASSRFHAMMITGALDKSIETIISAANNLPSVRLIVMDDWCDSSGKIPKFQLDLISRLSNSISSEIRLLLISKGTVDASGKRVGEIFARAENHFVKEGYEIWTFCRSSNGHHRILNIGSNSTTLKIVDSGLESVT